MDPTGMGYVSKTYSSIVGGGEPMNAIEFRKLIMNPSIKKVQAENNRRRLWRMAIERKHISDSYGIDTVLVGGRPSPILEVFKKAVNGEAIPRLVKADESLSNWNYNVEMPLTKNVAIHEQWKFPRAVEETVNSVLQPCKTKSTFLWKKLWMKSP